MPWAISLLVLTDSHLKDHAITSAKVKNCPELIRPLIV
jgi:hypothetical protein